MRRAWLLVVPAAALAGALVSACTSATVRKTTSTATWTATVTPPATSTPVPAPTGTPLGAAMTAHVKTNNSMGSVSATFWADVTDSLTMADLSPMAIAVTPPPGVTFFTPGTPGSTPAAYSSIVSLPSSSAPSVIVARFDSTARSDGLFEAPLSVGDVYGFGGNSAAFGKFTATAPVERILNVPGPVLLAPATPAAGTPFTVTWSVVPGAQSHLLGIVNGGGTIVWPASGLFYTTANSATVSPGLPSGSYFLFLITSDEVLLGGPPAALTNQSVAFRPIYVP